MTQDSTENFQTMQQLIENTTFDRKLPDCTAVTTLDVKCAELTDDTVTLPDSTFGDDNETFMLGCLDGGNTNSSGSTLSQLISFANVNRGFCLSLQSFVSLYVGMRSLHNFSNRDSIIYNCCKNIHHHDKYFNIA